MCSSFKNKTISLKKENPSFNLSCSSVPLNASHKLYHALVALISAFREELKRLPDTLTADKRREYQKSLELFEKYKNFTRVLDRELSINEHFSIQDFYQGLGEVQLYTLSYKSEEVTCFMEADELTDSIGDILFQRLSVAFPDFKLTVMGHNHGRPSYDVYSGQHPVAFLERQGFSYNDLLAMKQYSEAVFFVYSDLGVTVYDANRRAPPFDRHKAICEWLPLYLGWLKSDEARARSLILADVITDRITVNQGKEAISQLEPLIGSHPYSTYLYNNLNSFYRTLQLSDPVDSTNERLLLHVPSKFREEYPEYNNSPPLFIPRESIPSNALNMKPREFANWLYSKNRPLNP